MLRFLITIDGTVSSAEIINTEPEGVFENAVLTRVRKWKFRPGRLRGKTVPTRAELPFRFKLSSILGPPYWKLLSRIHQEQKEYRKAASAMELALALPDTTHQEWRELGGLYLWIGAPIEAAACYEKGLGDNPKAEWLDLLAECYGRAGRPDKACVALDRAMTIAPVRDRLLQKIRIRYRSGDYGRCQADARSCMQRFGEDGEAHYLAGVCAVEIGEWEEAAGSFRAAMGDERYREPAKGYLQILEVWAE